MSSPFLLSFTESIVVRLVDDGDLLLTGPPDDVIRHVASALQAAGENKQLVTTLTRALITSSAVDELYADDDRLKEIITELPFTAIRRGAS